jgi:uncharacterized OB-fold protein
MSDMGAQRRLLPAPEESLDAEFWAHCAKGELRFQRCNGCGAWRHLPRFACAACTSAEWTWERSLGRARLHSWTITHQPLIRDFAEPVPYAIAVVELEEGVRMVTGLRDVAYEHLALDLELEVVFETVADGVALPFFRPRRSD